MVEAPQIATQEWNHGSLAGGVRGTMGGNPRDHKCLFGVGAEIKVLFQITEPLAICTALWGHKCGTEPRLAQPCDRDPRQGFF